MRSPSPPRRALPAAGPGIRPGTRGDSHKHMSKLNRYFLPLRLAPLFHRGPGSCLLGLAGPSAESAQLLECLSFASLRRAFPPLRGAGSPINRGHDVELLSHVMISPSVFFFFLCSRFTDMHGYAYFRHLIKRCRSDESFPVVEII